MCIPFFILSLSRSLGKKYPKLSKMYENLATQLISNKNRFFFGFIRPDSHLTVSSVMFFSVIVVVVVSCLIRIKSLNLDQTEKTIFFLFFIANFIDFVAGLW